MTRARIALLLCVLTAAGCAAGQAAPTTPVALRSPTATPRVVPRPAVRPAVRPTPRRVQPRARHAPALVLSGFTVGIDPGHNGANGANPSVIDRPVWNGRETESCDTTGTATDAGYPEAQFTFAVAMDLATDLRAAGARVVLTRTTNTGVGPCVDRRAELLNAAGANVAVDIHADGGPSNGRGFTVLEPVPDGINNRAVMPSDRFATEVRDAFRALTGMPTSTYYGVDGIVARDDLAGLNLTTVPKVLIECGNMRNPTDAALLTSPAFQQRAAAALTAAVVRFLTGR